MHIFSKRMSFIILALLLTTNANAADYDLVISNGRVMDPETMFDDVANVGIKSGRIAIITKQKISGHETINADGLFEINEL